MITAEVCRAPATRTPPAANMATGSLRIPPATLTLQCIHSLLGTLILLILEVLDTQVVPAIRVRVILVVLVILEVLMAILHQSPTRTLLVTNLARRLATVLTPHPDLPVAPIPARGLIQDHTEIRRSDPPAIELRTNHHLFLILATGLILLFLPLVRTGLLRPTLPAVIPNHAQLTTVQALTLVQDLVIRTLAIQALPNRTVLRLIMIHILRDPTRTQPPVYIPVHPVLTPAPILVTQGLTLGLQDLIQNLQAQALVVLTPVHTLKANQVMVQAPTKTQIRTQNQFTEVLTPVTIQTRVVRPHILVKQPTETIPQLKAQVRHTPGAVLLQVILMPLTRGQQLLTAAAIHLVQFTDSLTLSLPQAITVHNEEVIPDTRVTLTPQVDTTTRSQAIQTNKVTVHTNRLEGIKVPVHINLHILDTQTTEITQILNRVPDTTMLP